ncbi:MAG: peptide deformylase [Patulibacter sp.]
MARERQLTDAELQRRDAALQQIRQWGDPSLKAVARPIDAVDDELVGEARRLITIMDAAFGAGLAATQVGILRRYFVYREGDEELGAATALINPVVEWSSDETDVQTEGCLSLQGVAVDVERPSRVRVGGLDLSGHQVTIDAAGGLARRLQHEIDHLDGILMLDRCPKDQRKAAVRALREGEAMERDDD